MRNGCFFVDLLDNEEGGGWIVFAPTPGLAIKTILNSGYWDDLPDADSDLWWTEEHDPLYYDESATK